MVHHKQVSIIFKIDHWKVILQRRHCDCHFIVFFTDRKKGEIEKFNHKNINKLTD